MINLTEVSYQLPAMKSEVVAVGGASCGFERLEEASIFLASGGACSFLLMAAPSYRRL